MWPRKYQPRTATPKQIRAAFDFGKPLDSDAEIAKVKRRKHLLRELRRRSLQQHGHRD